MSELEHHSLSTKRKPQRTRRPKFNDHFIREVRVQYESLSTEMFKIRDSKDAAKFLRQVAFDNCREHFFALYLNGNHQVACYSLVALGGAISCPVHPREIFQRAVLCGATAIIIAHNHPSGALQPSPADWAITTQLRAVGEVLSIPILDHIIFSDFGELSMRDHPGWTEAAD